MATWWAVGWLGLLLAAFSHRSFIFTQPINTSRNTEGKCASISPLLFANFPWSLHYPSSIAEKIFSTLRAFRKASEARGLLEGSPRASICISRPIFAITVTTCIQIPHSKVLLANSMIILRCNRKIQKPSEEVLLLIRLVPHKSCKMVIFHFHYRCIPWKQMVRTIFLVASWTFTGTRKCTEKVLNWRDRRCLFSSRMFLRFFFIPECYFKHNLFSDDPGISHHISRGFCNHPCPKRLQKLVISFTS